MMLSRSRALVFLMVVASAVPGASFVITPQSFGTSQPLSALAFRDPNGLSNLGQRRRCAAPLRVGMLFEGFFKQNGDNSKDEYGKFERHGKLEGVDGAFGPRGEDELEVLAETLENVLSGPDGMPGAFVPIAVLGKEDFQRKVKLRDVLSQLNERDSVLPDDAADVSVPLVLLSGFAPLQVSGAVQALRRAGIRGGEPRTQVAPLFAIAVPKAMDKDVAQLLEELEGDAQVNDPAAPPS